MVGVIILSTTQFVAVAYLLICLVKPFPPFKTRKQVMGLGFPLLLASFFLMPLLIDDANLVAAKPSVSKNADTLVLDTQRALQQLGYDIGKADGLFGPRTKTAIERFQRESGFTTDGAISTALLEQIKDQKPSKITASNAPTNKALLPHIPVTKLLDTETYDVPVVTRLSLRLLATEDLTKDKLRRDLMNLYRVARKQTGFKFSDHPTAILIYAYLSEYEAKDGMNWVGMLSWNDTQKGPDLSFADVRLRNLGKPGETKFGHSEEDRIKIFSRYILAVERPAKDEAHKRFPNNHLPKHTDYNDFTDYSRELIKNLKKITPFNMTLPLIS